MAEGHAQLVADSTVGKVAKATIDLGIPGFSRYMDNEIKEGALHTLAGLVAGIAIGPAGVLLVAANSISRSNSGRNLWELFQSKRDTADDRADAAEPRSGDARAPKTPKATT
jgi:hypothetical protein